MPNYIYTSVDEETNPTLQILRKLSKSGSSGVVMVTPEFTWPDPYGILEGDYWAQVFNVAENPVTHLRNHSDERKRFLVMSLTSDVDEYREISESSLEGVLDIRLQRGNVTRWGVD